MSKGCKAKMRRMHTMNSGFRTSWTTPGSTGNRTQRWHSPYLSCQALNFKSQCRSDICTSPTTNGDFKCGETENVQENLHLILKHIRQDKFFKMDSTVMFLWTACASRSVNSWILILQRKELEWFKHEKIKGSTVHSNSKEEHCTFLLRDMWISFL